LPCWGLWISCGFPGGWALQLGSSVEKLSTNTCLLGGFIPTGPRLGSGVLSEGRGLPVGLVPLLGGSFLSSSCSCFSAGLATSFGMPYAFRRTSSSGSGPVWPVSGRPHRVPILSPSGVVPAPGGGAAPCAPGKCSPSGRARTALAAWLPLRSWLVQGGASSVGPSGSPFVEVYWWSFSVAAFLPVSSWWEGGRPHCSVPATGT
jgi:hypothetical protein